jgi:methylated-DNA-[protein]-cysteine S-methyltransferase
MSDVYYSSVITRIGQVFVTATQKGVTKIFFGERGFRSYLEKMSPHGLAEGGPAAEMAREIELYFEGRLTEFKTPLDLSSGTEFQRAVWQNLLTVPYGKVTTYGELAEKVGKPGAARAVGNAVGVNPLPIVVPCHRVVASNGLGGYTGGIDIKKVLLGVEGVPT